jgi:PAS domain-containing protein
MQFLKKSSVERLMVSGFVATFSILLLVAGIALNYAVESPGAVNLIKTSIVLLALFLALLFVMVQRAMRLRSAQQQALLDEPLLRANALQDAIFNSANFSSIATDAEGVIQIFNVGAERMLGYAAADVVDKLTPANISDEPELVARAAALTAELGAPGLRGAGV